MHRFSLVDQSDPIHSPARIETWHLAKFPGSIAGTDFVAANQPYVDRSGQIFISDRYGSVTRFHPGDFDAEIDGVFSIQPSVAPIVIDGIDPIDVGVIEPTETMDLDSSMVRDTTVAPIEIAAWVFFCEYCSRSTSTRCSAFTIRSWRRASFGA